MTNPTQKAEEMKVDEFLRESNAIEGVYDETSFKQAKTAWQYLMKQKVLTTGVVLRTHKILMLHSKLAPNQKGYFRTVDVWVGKHKGIHPILVPEQIDEWCQGILVSNDEEEIRHNHIDYECIHPFLDGNGRTGRMFMNWQRIQAGLPVLVIKADERGEYYKWFR